MIKVANVKADKNGKIRFSITDDKFTIYGCTLAKTKDGNEFVSFPSYKIGEKCLNNAFCKLTDEETSAIICAVNSMANAE